MNHTILFNTSDWIYNFPETMKSYIVKESHIGLAVSEIFWYTQTQTHTQILSLLIKLDTYGQNCPCINSARHMIPILNNWCAFISAYYHIYIAFFIYRKHNGKKLVYVYKLYNQKEEQTNNSTCQN